MSNNPHAKKITISLKLICTIIPFMALAIIIMMSFNYISAKNTVIKSAEQTLHKETVANVNTIQTFIESTLSSLNRVYDTMRTVTFSSEEDTLNYLATTCDIQPEIPLGVYIGNNNDYWLDPSGWHPPEDYHVSEQSWYQEGLSHTSFTLGEPYIDASTSTYIVSATALLSSENGLDTVIAADISLDALSKDIASMRVMDTGHCFLVDTKTLTILAHQNTSLIGTALSANSDDAILKAAASMSSVRDYAMQNIHSGGTDYMVAVKPIKNTNWILVSCIDKSAFLSDLSNLQVFCFVLSIIVILITAIILSQIIRITVAPVKTLTNTISAITDGDFSVDIEVKGNDEISAMSRALKEFVEIMREVIGDIRTVSTELSDQSEASKEVASELNETSAVLTESMGEMVMTIEQLTTLLPEEHTDISEEIHASWETLADTSLELSQESADVAACAGVISESAFTLAEHMRKFQI